MPMGILEPRHGRDVPGTVLLDDRAADGNIDIGVDVSHLKCGTGKYSHIILNPQPSDDPNDPLNWPQSKKIMTMSAILISGILCAVVSGPLLSAGTVTIAEDLGVSISAVSLLTGESLLIAGCWCIPVSVLSRIWGKRPQFVFAVMMNIVATVVSIASFPSNKYSILRAGRLLQGLATSCFESIVFAVIVDMFFIHERGAWVAATIVVLTGLSNLSPLISGQITNNLGWHWNLYIYLIFAVITFFLTFFFAPETTYKDPYRTPNSTQLNSEHHLDNKINVDHEERLEAASTPPICEKRTYLQSLAIFTGTYTEPKRALNMVARLLIVLLNPASWFLLATQALITAFWVAISFTLAQIYAPSPYFLDPSGVGLLFAGPFIGAVIGCIFMFWADDRAAIWIARRNDGIYEPEFRLPLLLIAFVMAPIGYFLMGWSMEAEKGPVTGAAFYGIAAIGVSVSNAAGSSYISDSHPDIALEAFIWASFSKNLLFYGFATFINDWVEDGGAETVFYTLGGLSAALILTGLPMYILGKKNRDIWNKWDLVGKYAPK